MVPNVKYHVITVTSIFLALGIGIYIGFMLDAQDLLTSQKQTMVSELEEKFDYIKEENQKTKKEIEQVSNENKMLQEFNKLTYSEIIKNKLDGFKIAIIETNDDYIDQGVKQTLELSGAKVTSITTIKDIFLSSEDKLKEVYTNITGREKIEGNIFKVVMDEITLSIIKGEVSPLVQALAEQGIININGLYDQSVDHIVLIGGSKKNNYNKFENIDEKIINVAKKNNKNIVGVERTDAKYSYAERYKNNRISSIDNIDSVIGKVSLVITLKGSPGNYGVKPSADSLIPDISSLSY
ncbi:protein of unknown function DUF3186 [Gottschalkia purinilytica]|uniref:Copper transport outer membrane protein, MctB n=1 Tax=Gottschalkia purinilytica TaxID=1503 RepID=A0A0L0W7Z1_GOTPU|nr:copper transporter [Gottschalkia purinilytica]KNF07415.1 protein of unknown function DUF3186 [Gottschalkia purinilytica]